MRIYTLKRCLKATKDVWQMEFRYWKGDKMCVEIYNVWSRRLRKLVDDISDTTIKHIKGHP